MNIQHVKKILENYSKYNAKSIYCKEHQIEPEKTEAISHFRVIENYIENMDSTLQMVIKMIYVQGYSLRKCARESHYCYKTIIRKRDKAIRELVEILDLYNMSNS